MFKKNEYCPDEYGTVQILSVAHLLCISFDPTASVV